MIRGFSSSTPCFGRDVFIADTASVVGDVELADEVSVWFGAVLRGDVGKIRIGARTNIQDNASVHMTHAVSDALIGSDVIVGHNAVVHGARVADRVLVGMGAIVMDNADLQEGCWVAAGSVVPAGAVVPRYTLVRGAPARAVRLVNDAERAWAEDAVLRYLSLAREHKLQQRASGVTLP